MVGKCKRQTKQRVMKNLKDSINLLEKIIKAVPNAGTVFLNDIYQLNQMQEVNYPAYCITQQQHTQTDDIMSFNFTLFYVDRLKDDETNRIDVQSTAISVLKQIIDTLPTQNVLVNSDVTYTTFNERFNDKCAGAYANISIMYNADECGVPLELNLD